MDKPDRIYIDRGPNGGWMFRTERMPDTEAEYVRADRIEALQADLAAAEQRGYLRGLEESAGVREALEKSAKHCPQCDGVGSYDFGPPRNKYKVPCEFCEIARNALKDKQP